MRRTPARWPPVTYERPCDILVQCSLHSSPATAGFHREDHGGCTVRVSDDNSWAQIHLSEDELSALADVSRGDDNRLVLDLQLPSSVIHRGVKVSQSVPGGVRLHASMTLTVYLSPNKSQQSSARVPVTQKFKQTRAH